MKTILIIIGAGTVLTTALTLLWVAFCYRKSLKRFIRFLVNGRELKEGTKYTVLYSNL